MHLGHPLFMWNLKYVAYGLYKQLPFSCLLLIPFFSFLTLWKHCQKENEKR